MTNEQLQKIALTSERPFYDLDFQLGKETAIEAFNNGNMEFWLGRETVFGKAWMEGFLSVYNALK